MAQNAAVAAARFVLLDLLGDVVAFPVWWYTRGFAKFLAWCAGSARYQWQSIGLGVWLKNLFVPMFGQTDLWGRVISFFLRVFQVLGRGLWFLVSLALLAALVALWALFPPALVALVALQVGGLLVPAS